MGIDGDKNFYEESGARPFEDPHGHHMFSTKNTDASKVVTLWGLTAKAPIFLPHHWLDN